MIPVVNSAIEKYENEVHFRIVDIDNSKNKAEMDKYQVSVIPYFIFIDKDGEIIDKRIGYIAQQEFFKLIDQIK